MPGGGGALGGPPRRAVPAVANAVACQAAAAVCNATPTAPDLARALADAVARAVPGALRARVAAELKTTFASHYTKTLSLRDVLDPEAIKAYNRKATGEKFLINPSL